MIRSGAGDEHPPGPPTHHRGRLLSVLAALSAFGPLTTDVYLPGLPGVTEALRATPSGAQLTLTACVVGLGLGQLLVGPLSDMLGRRGPLIAGLGVFIAASLCCAVAPSLPILIAARLVQGIAGAAGIVISRAMVRDLYSGIEAARTYSTLSAIVTAGPVFAPMIGAGLLLFTEWRGVFVALAAIGVALLVAASLGTKETLPASARRERALGRALSDIAALARHRHYMSLALTGAFAFGALFAYIAASSFVYQDVFGFSPQIYAVLFAVNGLTLMGANLVNANLVRRIPQPRLILAGLGLLCGGGALLLAATALDAGAYLVLPPLLLVAAGAGLVISNSIALAMENERSRAGSASALFGLLQFGTGAVVAPLVGLAGTSAVPMGIAIATFALLALGSFTLLDPSRPG